MITLGLMSGSSLDGLDVALCQFSDKLNKKVEWQIIEAETFFFPTDVSKKLSKLANLTVQEIAELDVALAKFSANCIKKIPSWQSANAIGSHGHTVLHEPKKGFSYQITNPWTLAAETNKVVVSDFRNADIVLGGQGAPLVPKADIDLFPEYDAYLNLGGIANITKKHGSAVLAYDVCACNQWLNALCKLLGKDYDKDGSLSKLGKMQSEIISSLESWDFVKLNAPKSLSNIACEVFYKNTILPFTKKYTVEDVLKSCIVFIGNCIKKELKGANKILISGGGAYNNTLISGLNEELNIETQPSNIINFKEALAFAYLAHCKLNGQNANIPSATGAQNYCQLGAIFKI